MTQLENNNDDFTSDNLFPDDDFLSIIDNIPFSGDLQLEDNLPYESLLASLFGSANEEYPETTDGNNSSELIHLALDAQNDTNAIFDGEQPIENLTGHQNTNVINMPIPQQASGSQDGIMYQMYPSIFADITGTMSVKQEPKANNRSRYQCDGLRFLPDSRYHPMSINLPDLRSSLLPNDTIWGIVMTIVMGKNLNDQESPRFVHTNDITCDVNGAIKIAHGCVFVPLEQADRQNGEKKFPRLSINYKKCDEYTFDLTPFNKFTMFGPTEKYISENKKNVGKAAKAKDFKREYNLLSYKFIFQLAVKQSNVVYISNISCETEVIDEQKVTTTQSGKRSASVSSESYLEEESNSDIQISSPTKKFKSSTPPSPPPLIGLPVTRVSNHGINFNTDDQQ